MFTVIIAEKEHIQAVQQENRLFFEPFLKKQELAFCEWDPEGQTFFEAVPGLAAAVGRKKDWRAVLVCPGKSRKDLNPYDVVKNAAQLVSDKPAAEPVEGKEEEWEQSWKDYYEAYWEQKEKAYAEAMTYPLQKLTNILCYRPQDYLFAEVETNQDAEDWALDHLLEKDAKPSVKLERIEQEEFRSEQRFKETLKRSFVEEYLGEETSIGMWQPSEVICIAARTTESGFFDPALSWKHHEVQDYSEFAERNMYPERARFLVFDILPEKHASFRVDRIRFLYDLLILASNPIPDSTLQPRRLYVIDSDNSEGPLAELITSYHVKLGNTFDQIEHEVERIRGEIPGELSDQQAEALFCAKINVPVMIDKEIDQDTLFAETRNYGLSFDCPENEFSKWNAAYRSSLDTVEHLVKQPRRAVKKAVDKLDFYSVVESTQIGRLNSFQLDDVREFTEREEDTMVSAKVADLYDITRYREKMEAEKEKVENVLNRRMTRKTTVILGCIVLGTFLICLLPLILSNRTDAGRLSLALGITLSFLGALAAILLVCLYCLRLPLKKALRSFNRTVGDILQDVKKTISAASKYLSALCNVRRGYSVLNYSEKYSDPYLLSIQIRRKHQEDIRMRKAVLQENYRDFLSDDFPVSEDICEAYEYDFGKETEYDYPVPYPAAASRQVEFLMKGNYITVPTAFVRRITLRLEEIYDK